jgi:transketolase
MSIEPIASKFDSFGWGTSEIDGHDPSAVLSSLNGVGIRDRPQLIVARTRKGKGVGFMETSPYWHLGYLGPIDRELAEHEILERMER